MISTATPTPHRRSYDRASSGSDPAVMSAKVRELAEGSRRAIAARPADRPAEADEPLRELRRQVERLRQKVHVHRMSARFHYVDAISARLDDCLSRDPGRGGRAAR